MKKIHLLLLTILSFASVVCAQPGAISTNNITAGYDCRALTAPSGSFEQSRIQATQSSTTVSWEFPANCGFPGDVWRPYGPGNGGAVVFNTTIAPVGGTGSALYNSGNGGVSGLLSPTTNGNYYTFNIENVGSGTNARMAVLETSYNPVTISSVSNTTPANTSNAVLVTCTTSAAPSGGEYVYVRYSTDITFVSSSSISQFTFSGTTGQALIPCQAAGPVYYYVFSSNQTSAQIATQVGTYGRIAYDMLALNLNNGGGSNYTYTQGNGTNFGGIYSVPSSCYATVSAFVTALNAGTVTAPVTCYAIGGSATETATAGGIAITQTGTAANPIIFQKFGSGFYTVQASPSLTVGALNDAIFKLIGADYITIDGFNMVENGSNTISASGATNNMTEWGVALLHTSVTDGAQNNTIQNNTITLNKTYLNTFGIYSNVRHSATSVTATQDITNATTAPNSGNKFYGNTISNVNMGIAIIGSGTSAYQDVNNDIGGSSLSTGNTISNWGGAAALTAYVSNSGTSYCIFSNNQTSENISYNTISSAVASGASVTFCGIRKDYTASQPTGTVTSNITNNTITMLSGFTSGTFDAILNQGLTPALSTATINITNNTILNCVMSGGASSSSFIAIANSSAPGVLNITNNIIKGTISTATTGGFTGISNTGAVATTINISNNSIGNGGVSPITFSVATTGIIYGILNTNGTAGATLTMSNNTVDGITCVSSGQIAGIASTVIAGISVVISGNSILNTTVTGVAASSNIIGILNTNAATPLSITNNIIRGNTSAATTGGFVGIQNSGAVPGTISISNNQIGSASTNAVTLSAATNSSIIGINNINGTATTTLNITSNAIQGLSGVSTSSNTYGILNSSSSGVAINITGNTLGSSGRDFVTYTAASTGPVYGILNSGGASTTNLTVTNNTVDRITGVSFSNILAGIANTSAATGGTINLNNNAIGTTTGTFLTTTASSTGTFYAMWNSNGATTAAVNMNNNTVDGFFINATTVNLTTMACNGANIASASVTGNSFGSTGTLINFSGVQTGTFRVIDLGVGSSNAASTIVCQNNIIKGIIYTPTGTSTTTCIFINSNPLSATISGNSFTNLNINVTGTVWMILDIANRTSGQSLTINNNSIVTGLTKTAGSGDVNGFYTVSSSVNGASLNVTNNNFSNITVSGASNVYGILASDGLSSSSGPTLTVSGNTISNISAASGTVWGIYADYSAGGNINSNMISSINSNYIIYGIDIEPNNSQNTMNVYSNTLTNFSSTGASGHVRGVLINSTNAPTVNVYSNTMTNYSTAGVSNFTCGVMSNSAQTLNIYDNTINTFTNGGTSAPLAAGINLTGGTTFNIYRNKIHSLTASGNFTASSTLVAGIRLTAGTTATVYNNFVANLTAPNVNYTDVIHGLDISSSVATSNYYLYYNSVYVNASSSGTDFGTAGIYHLTNATATTGALSMIDNIVVNTSTANGAGLTAAYRRSDATLANYASVSDYNLLYAGNPSVTNLIYYDGTNTDQTLAAYQTRVSFRDANSISVMPNFTSSTDLHLTGNNCSIDGAGTPIAITADIDAQTRDITTPDIGADEFTATYGTTLAGVAGSAVCQNKNVSPSGTTFATSSCSLIATVLPSGGAQVSGKINTCVTLDATQQYYNAEPYVQRHFDIEPATANTTTTSATITLYFTDAEFVNFNTNNPSWPKLPTVAGGGSADPNRANLRITQYHGTPTTTPSTPGNYTANSGAGVVIDPVDANIVWNGSYWAVTFDVTGFSGFYAHSFIYALPITLNYLNGIKQGGNHLLSWKVTCNSTPSATLTLERSADGRVFSAIYNITATALRCNQPFDYTDAQPLNGINYYRLKMVDADGKVSYSGIVALLNAAKGFDLVNIVPNPVTSTGIFTLNISSALQSKMELQVTDMQGRVVARQTVSLIAGYNRIGMNVVNLPAGTYTISGMTADDKTRVLRFVKQ